MRIRPAAARVLAVSAGAVLVLGLAACGGDDSDGTTVSSVGSASAPAGAESPTTVAAAFERMAKATADAKSVRGSLETKSTQGEGSGDFTYEFTPSGVNAAFSFEQDGKNFKGVLVGDQLFVGGDGLPLPPGREYLKVDLKDTSGPGKAYAGLAESMTQASDLETSVAQWRSMDDLREVGTETIEGVKATKYVGTVNPAKPPADAPASAKEAYAALAKAGGTKVETTIWIGPDGLPIRFKAVSDGSAAGTTVVTYTDWGTGASITIPPASKVANLSSLVGG